MRLRLVEHLARACVPEDDGRGRRPRFRVDRAGAADLAGSGVESRVQFHHRDAADAAFAERFDLVTIFEALHDMPRPVDVLRTVGGMLNRDAFVLIGDERTEDSFTAPAGERERLYYGFSVMSCLPSGMVGTDPAGTGTLMRPDTLRRYATVRLYACRDSSDRE